MSWATTFYWIAASIAVDQSYRGAKAQKATAEHNAEISDIEAADAKKRGETAAMAARRNGKQLEGVQRASYAARGLDLGVGTPSDVIDQTDFFTQTDEATARTNAAKEAWAIKARGQGQRAQADAISPGMSLLGSGSQVAAKWYAGSGAGGGAANSSDYSGSYDYRRQN